MECGAGVYHLYFKSLRQVGGETKIQMDDFRFYRQRSYDLQTSTLSAHHSATASERKFFDEGFKTSILLSPGERTVVAGSRFDGDEKPLVVVMKLTPK